MADVIPIRKLEGSGLPHFRGRYDLGSELCIDEETDELIEVGEEIEVDQGRIRHSKYVVRDGIKHVYATKELPQ